jgi:hypothetical protein
MHIKGLNTKLPIPARSDIILGTGNNLAIRVGVFFFLSMNGPQQMSDCVIFLMPAKSMNDRVFYLHIIVPIRKHAR